MNRSTLLLAAAAGMAALLLGSTVVGPIAGAAGAWQVTTLAYKLLNIAGSGNFSPVQGSKDLLRLNLWWRQLPVAVIPDTAFLVKEGGSWVLVDAGAPDNWSQAYASKLVQAVQTTVGHGRLKAILLTHGHLDHVGALPKLLEIYPDVPVIVHSGEAPFLTEQGAEYMPGSSMMGLLRTAGAIPPSDLKLPKDRLTLLHGSEGGSLRGYGINTLTWHFTPGHCPGHISFLHQPSGMLLAGDALFMVLPSFSFAGGLASLVTRPLGWVYRPVARMAFGPAKAALNSLLSGSLPPPLNAALSKLGLDRLTDASRAAVPNASVGQELGTWKLLKVLPGVTVRISPSIVCLGPRSDVEQAQASVCALAKLKFQRLLPVHDATGKGLTYDDIVTYASSLPGCDVSNTKKKWL